MSNSTQEKKKKETQTELITKSYDAPEKRRSKGKSESDKNQ